MNSYHTNPGQLSQEEMNQQYSLLARESKLLPIKVTQFYNKKVLEEVAALGHHHGPLHRVAYPSLERLTTRAPGEVADFVDDRENMQASQGFIIKKYRERFLFLPTAHCFGHCQYCFRQDVLEEQKTKKGDKTSSQIATVVSYINQHPELEEIILTGGDPMILPFKTLYQILTSIKTETNIASIRIHSRALIYAPDSLSVEKIQLLYDTNVRFVSHIAHPYEVCDKVLLYIQKLKEKGIKLYNQFPLLRNTNDHPYILIKHIKHLEEWGIRTLSIFIPDPINYSAAYRITLKRLKKIIDEFKWSSPSWVNSTRFVLDTPHGKVRMEDLIDYNEHTKIALFKREEKQIEYHDLPEELDVPGDLKTMLWKG